MLDLNLPENEIYIPAQNKFIFIPACTLTLEHSLISIAKWESKWNQSYLSSKNKTNDQELDYIRCMVVGPLKNGQCLYSLTPRHISMIHDYCNAPMTATTFSKRPQKVSNKIVTAETLYSRMFAANIPMECQKWHLNRLLVLLRACEETGGSGSKMTKRQTAAYYAEQNALRRAKYKSKG